MKVDEFPVVELVHDINFLLDEFLFHCTWYRYEFGSEDVTGRPLSAAMYDTKRACAYNSICTLCELWFLGYGEILIILALKSYLLFYCK